VECYTHRMDLPSDVKARRALEDKAIMLGNERTRLERRLEEIIEEAVGLMAQADRRSVSVDRLAELIRIDRTTLYRWRDMAARHRTAREDPVEQREE
jgi:hypothetical protein